MPEYSSFYNDEILKKHVFLAKELKQSNIENVFFNISSMGKILGFFIKNVKKLIVVDKARTECMAAIYAAKKANIETEEIQHGVFTQNDFWYTHQSYYPRYLSFEVDKFSVYQKSALEAVNTSSNFKNAVFSKSIWHAYLKSINIKKTKEHVLIALYLEQDFEQIMAKIALYLKNYKVVVRQHPLQKDVEIPMGMSLSTHSIIEDLSASWLVLSFSPTIVYDAESLQIPSIFMLPIAIETSPLIKKYDAESFEQQIEWAKTLSYI